MKKTNKIFSVVLALVLVLAMAIPAFAAGTWTGSITINSAANVSVDGKNFNAYKLLDAEAVDADDLSKGVLYSFNTEWKGFFDANFADKTVEQVVDAINAPGYDLNAFAELAYAYAKTNGIAADATATGAGTSATFNDLALGYYLIEDAGAATPISALMLKSTSAEVTLKADKPSIEKKIDGDNDGDDTTTNGLVDYNTAKVGDSVPYVLTSKVPDTTGYTDYTYTVKDTFSAGLTYNDDVAVTIGGVAYTDFTADYENSVLTVDVNGLTTQTVGAEIKITYSATVNANAVKGVAGNPNSVVLEYSNNPTEETSKETTPEDITRTYLVNLIVNKTDEEGNALAGAQFALKQGDATLGTGTSDADGLVVFTDDNGKAVDLIDGKTYTIVETQAPEGYNEAADISFTVTCTDPEAPATACTWTSNNPLVTFDAAENRFEATIENSTGSLLPETGGIGTTVFYVVGGILMLGAAVLLVTKKRMACEA